MPTRSRTSRFGASAMGWRSVIPRISPRLTQRRSRQAASDGSAVTERVESRTRYRERRDAAEGREIVLATQPPQLHQLEAPDLVEDRDVGDRAEAAFEPAKPVERAEPLEVDGPDPQALEPGEAADRVDVLPGPVDREPPEAREVPDRPHREALQRVPERELLERPRDVAEAVERAQPQRTSGQAAEAGEPAQHLEVLARLDAQLHVRPRQHEVGDARPGVLGQDAVDTDPRLVTAQRRQLVAGPGSDPAKRVAHDGERNARPSPPARSEFAGSRAIIRR